MGGWFKFIEKTIPASKLVRTQPILVHAYTFLSTYLVGTYSYIYNEYNLLTCLFIGAQPPGYGGYPAAGAATGAAAGYAAGQPTHEIVYVNGKPKKKKILGMNQKTAAGMLIVRHTVLRRLGLSSQATTYF